MSSTVIARTLRPLPYGLNCGPIASRLAWRTDEVILRPVFVSACAAGVSEQGASTTVSINSETVSARRGFIRASCFA